MANRCQPLDDLVFAETRPRRMHAAIDIKTWNRTGYKVFAVRDGYIQRIRVSPFGYGKVIYQKLDTGEIALYAHLDGFNPELEAYVARQQEKSGKYSIDRYLTEDAFPVKKGMFWHIPAKPVSVCLIFISKCAMPKTGLSIHCSKVMQ